MKQLILSDGRRGQAPGHIIMIIADAHAPDARLQKEIQSLVRVGYSVDVVCWDRADNDRLPAYTDERHGVVHRYKRISARGKPFIFLLNNLLFYAFAVRKVHAQRPDFIHVHSVQVLPLGVLLKALTGRPLVYDAHEITETFGASISPRFGAGVWRWERALLRTVDLVLTVSEGLRERYAETVRPHVEVVTLLNCLAPRTADLAPERREGRPFTLGRIGNLRPRSRIDMIADIVIALNEMGYPVRFKYAGDAAGAYGKVVARAHEKMSEYADYTPWVPVDGFADFYADVEVVLNLHERGDPLEEKFAYFSKVFEAMALGVPPVINDFPSMTPFVGPTGAGVVVEDFTVRGFAEAIRELIEDPGRLEAMRAKCLSVARERLNWNVMEDRLLGSYARMGAPAR